jgi:hypothetical protein
MVPKLSSPLWEYFEQLEGLTYCGTIVYARCVRCTPSITNADRTKIASLLRSAENMEKRSGRAMALEAKLVPGKPPDMARHIASCSSVSDSVKFSVASYNNKRCSVSQDPCATRTSDAAAVVSSAPTNSTSSAKGKRRKTQAAISDCGVYGKRFQFETDAHDRLIADAVSVSKVPFNFFCGDLFRSLQKFYVGGAEVLKMSGLSVTPKKIRNLILPKRYSEALASLQVRVQDGPLAQGFTVADDGWASRRKAHYCVTSIARPGVPAETVSLSPIAPTDLHGVAIARGWERLIILAEQGKPVGEYPEGFYVSLPRRPDAFCSDSFASNTRARHILALRHPTIIFIPCFAHIFALICGDFMTLSSHASTIAKSMLLVSFFNNSSSLWLPLLREEMIR